ncbi:hypothetical protein [Streptomyces sp. NPDC093094]|uniref:hypothetical protein n=1 Tax=Streptomyces sp. NPDC093094 TaxID=3366026 RepID=UPI0037FCD2FA
MNALNYEPPRPEHRPPRPPEHLAETARAAHRTAARTTARTTGRYVGAHAVCWSLVAVLPLPAGSSLATRVAGGLTVGGLLFALLAVGTPLSSWWLHRATRGITERVSAGGADASSSGSGR